MPAELTITGLLQGWSRGDAAALEQLAPLVQTELRGIARRLLSDERAGLVQPTELVHDAYLRLLDWPSVRWQNRAHFFATVAGMMRRSLIDAARARRSLKRAADVVPFSDHELAAPARPLDLLQLDDLLDALAVEAPRAAQIIELRFFGGFTNEETAEALGVSVRTVINDWNTARAWLYRHMHQTNGDAR